MKRPMERAATPLRQMGAQIETLGGKPPVRISGGAALKGIRYELPVASAQVKSAVLLRAVCEGRDDGDRAGCHARSHRAHAAELRLPGRRGARRRAR